MFRVSRAAGKVHDRLDTQFFGQEDCLPAGGGVKFRQRLIGMQGVAMTAQAADGESFVLELLLEFFQLGSLVQPFELKVRLPWIIPGTQFQGPNAEWFHFLNHFIQTQIGKQGCKQSNFHGVSPPFLRVDGIRHKGRSTGFLGIPSAVYCLRFQIPPEKTLNLQSSGPGVNWKVPDCTSLPRRQGYVAVTSDGGRTMPGRAA